MIMAGITYGLEDERVPRNGLRWWAIDLNELRLSFKS